MELGIDSRKSFFKSMITLALPITLQNLVSSSLNMVDTMMIGKLGANEIAAVGLANQFYFLFSLIIFGVSSGCAIFISQFWGKGDRKSIKRVLGISLLISSGIGVVFTILAVITPGMIMKFFTEDAVVIGLGKEYLIITGLSYIVTAISYTYSFASRSVGQPKLPLFTSTVALICNTVLNAIFIFGYFGFPAMGVKGAAIATLIARIVEMILIVGIIYAQKSVLAAKFSQMIDLSKDFIKIVLITIAPVILNEFLWSLGMTMYSVAYAKISIDAVAAVQIATTVKNLFMVVAFGLGNACAIMIGSEIGSGNEHKAMILGKRFIKLTIAIGAVLGVIIFIASGAITSFFNVTESVSQSTESILKLYSFIIPVNMLCSLFVVGVLRSGGDTKFSLFLEGGTIWFIGVPCAFLGALVFNMSIEAVVLLSSLELVVKLIIVFPRFFSQKWVKNLVKHI
ncbi:MAG: MATE family efflux transporter [Clostridium sp.]